MKPTRRQTLGIIGTAIATTCTSNATAKDSEPATVKSPIKIGQIGTKHAHAIGKLQAIRKFPDVFEVVGVVEPDAERRSQLRDHESFADIPWMTERELFAQQGLQAVAVETEVVELVPTAIRCIENNLHIHLDKPAGEDLDACRRLHDLALQNNRTIQMGYMLRYNPAFEFAKQIVDDGWLGQITEINAMMGKYMNDAGRLDLSKYAGGGMFELACHLIDQVVYLLGPPTGVSSFNRRSFPSKDNFADNQLAILEYPKTLATIRCNHIDPMGGPRRSFSVTGTEGTFEINPLEPHPKGRLGLAKPRGTYRKGFQDVSFQKPSGRYDAEFLDLAAVIRGEKTLRWDAAHDVATHEAILRASGVI
ncbi:Gfo/Idh/MocA family oxidoreductase [Stieleria sp. JC731]|uniref:Gfo/Idh/MocA family protein n=1 Tax=Pirellulaceae TaxID=2691357 RepID=UPI001E5F828B|nr:Gfo/Idh/MocA family oxidoreductase [Stieleria sp. JC731]MCC9603564.1 Gfo/Idh/MocA family oxidoreductase [Stieleria sp. JC731]